MSQFANLSDTAANAQALALAALCNAGTINIYSGTQPASANTALSGNTLLASLTFGNPAFGAPSQGQLTANAITSATAANSGTATFARILQSNGTTVMDAPVGVAGAAINLSTVAIVGGNNVALTAFTHTVTESAAPSPNQTVNLSDTAANAQAAALALLCNGGSLGFYDGIQPTSANNALASNNLLVTLDFQETAFGPPAGGVLAANTIPAGTIVASGIASFLRVFESNGTTVVMDIVVDTANAAVQLNTTSLVAGASLALNPFGYTVSKGFV